MRPTIIGATALALVAAFGAAAQTAGFGEIDLDGDGALSQEEISAAYGAGLVSRILDDHDANGDGVLTSDEVATELDETVAGYDQGSVVDEPEEVILENEALGGELEEGEHLD